jgi:dimethylhistidine N-methyltransferase
MLRAQRSRRYAWIEEDESDLAQRDAFREAVADGLAAQPFSLPCRFFYDAVGSQLFEEICELPEYYLTRAEHEILSRHADEIAAHCVEPLILAELGSGSATKTRLLIEAFLRKQGELRYLPVDISQSMLEQSTEALLADYDGLTITAIASEYREGLHHLGKDTRLPKLIAWLGSNIGNFSRSDARHFLSGIRDAMNGDDRLLLGIDLRKDAHTLERAYDDARGVTARFNKNLLARINRELGGAFDLADFRHRARVVDGGGRVEIGLVCERSCEVRVAALGRSFRFARGDFIHTEDSTKYSEGEIGELAGAAALRIDARWLDSERRFCVALLASR